MHGEFNVDGHHIAIGYGDGSIQLFSVFDWKFVERIPRAHGAAVTSIMQMPDGRMGIAVADVTGKGVPAALLMANVQAGLRMGYEAALAGLDPEAHNRVVFLSDGVGNIG